MSKPALGKGLGALIRKQPGSTSPDAAASVDGHGRAREVAIDLVVPSPLQPRTHFIDTPLDELMESIRQHGIIQPLIVRPVDGKFELIAGERRWRASKKLGLATVPVIEREASDRDVLEMALIENLQREDLNAIEEAAGYVRLAKEFSMKQEEIAARVGKSRASVANAMRLLDLHPDVQLMVAQGQLTVGHGKAILSIKDKSAQLLASDQILRKKLNVRAAEKLAQTFDPAAAAADAAKPIAAASSPAAPDAHMRALQNKLRDRFATHVMIHHGAKKGKIELEYYGDDDLQRILELLGVGEM
ncbi:ParB/RepB/Spo0J family partition protein [Luteolibacter sp. GHJ8]|uniref:ParB/RepB/Spo0J family partition protein n=1 Tax=Luteolibacter rhizosphaerae TaxID=2989719 RepID=A0ABT3G8N9_9BACT|nr:ParB/RepB/Spo0J family partition protein [Luteolibacter rhizosphaerae]MCW1916219.1 ParB/RepB/Spo0J family partition protein [Luteolibacter rhizosphaerae]